MIGSSDRDCARSPSHTTGHAVFRIRRLEPAIITTMASADFPAALTTGLSPGKD